MRIRSPLLTRLAARAAVLLVRLLFATCRVQARLETPGINPYEGTGGQRYLFCVWHDHILMTCFAGRPRNMAGLVSRHQDGSYLAGTMKLLGITPIRGSSSRGGAQAMRQMFDAARDLHIAITPDGPRGPRRQAKSGIVFLASHSGRAIVPTAFACRRAWRIRGSWTDMLLPRPFTTIYAIGGRPLDVPPELTREQLEQYTARLQAEMERLDGELECWMSGNRPQQQSDPGSDRLAA